MNAHKNLGVCRRQFSQLVCERKRLCQKQCWDNQRTIWKSEISCRFIAYAKIKSRWVGDGNVRQFMVFRSSRGYACGIGGVLVAGGLCCVTKSECESSQLPSFRYSLDVFLGITARLHFVPAWLSSLAHMGSSLSPPWLFPYLGCFPACCLGVY
jgi:hypothetical protein